LSLKTIFFFVLGLGFCVGDVTSGSALRFFEQLHPALGANPMSQFFG